MATDTREQAPRDNAVQQLKKRRDSYGHLLIYTLVNAFLVVIWAITDLHGFFWPVFSIGIWGIAVRYERTGHVLAAGDHRGRHPARDKAPARARARARMSR
jgi:hypothetical protein